MDDIWIISWFNHTAFDANPIWKSPKQSVLLALALSPTLLGCGPCPLNVYTLASLPLQQLPLSTQHHRPADRSKGQGFNRIASLLHRGLHRGDLIN